MTKGELLRYALAYALSKIRFERRKLPLSEGDRYQIADDTVALRKGSTWRELDDEVVPPIGHP
jgi:hypothetical protein